MGNRISIQFQQGETKSIVLFSHWRGMSLVEDANIYVKKLIEKYGPDYDGMYTPIARFEPESIMFDFIRTLVLHGEGDTFHLECTENDGDNSDNGHHIIELPKFKGKGILGPYL